MTIRPSRTLARPPTWDVLSIGLCMTRAMVAASVGVVDYASEAAAYSEAKGRVLISGLTMQPEEVDER